MNFTIIWSDAAVNDLAAIWVNVTDRTAITDAAAGVDRVCSGTPSLSASLAPATSE